MISLQFILSDVFPTFGVSRFLFRRFTLIKTEMKMERGTGQ